MQNREPACKAFKQHTTAETIHGGLQDEKLMIPQSRPDKHCVRGEEQSNGRAEPQGLCKPTMGNPSAKFEYLSFKKMYSDVGKNWTKLSPNS